MKPRYWLLIILALQLVLCTFESLLTFGDFIFQPPAFWRTELRHTGLTLADEPGSRVLPEISCTG